MPAASRPEPAAFIAANTRLLAVRSIPEVRLHTAHQATGLWRLARDTEGDDDPPPPYWAFPWAGGLALARHILDHPDTVAGRSVLDLGAGSGLVAIAAAKAGARSVLATDIDRYALAAIPLNAAANGVALKVVATDVAAGAPPAGVDLVLAGDVFYERPLAERMTAFFERCVAAGVSVIVGDPRRAYLPESRLRLIGEYAVPDVGEVEGPDARKSGVFAFVA